MPELPEVETIRQGLSEKILHKKIKAIKIIKPKLVKSNYNEFLKFLVGNKINKVDRVGKLLILSVGNKYLLIHLKMTGQLIYSDTREFISGGHPFPEIKADTLQNKSTAIIFTFTGNSQLIMNDQRLFGYLKLVNKEEKEEIVAKFGIEPLQSDFTLEKFKKIFIRRSAVLKAILLNQQLIAGIGNIYADEICFAASIMPDRRVNNLSVKEIENLYKVIQKVIAKAIKYKGTTFKDYRDSSGQAGNFVEHLKVYGRKGLKCLRCKQTEISKMKLAGRGTHYCPNCQK